MICFSQQIRNVLRRVTGSMPRRYEYFPKCETVTVSYFLGRESVLRVAFPAGVNLRRFQPRAKFARTTYQVRMNVRLENMCNGKAGLSRHVDINIYISSWVENRSDAVIVISQQI